jgi:choline dehydrogenase
MRPTVSKGCIGSERKTQPELARRNVEHLVAMTKSADVVVVGGGSSGAVVAARLAEHGVTVMLIEAGPDYGAHRDGQWPIELLDARMLATSHDWGYRSGPVPGRQPWTFERARVIGGCSSHNGAIAAVGHHTDYDAWGLDGWRTGELRSTFALVLETMRVRTYSAQEAGPFHARCLQAAAELGWRMAEDLCDLDANDSFGLESVNVVDGVRWNTALAYLDAVRHLPNFSVLDRAIVDRVEDLADGVTVHVIRDGRPVEVGAGTVVLSAGVYGTPAILQRSGFGDGNVLHKLGIEVRSHLPEVGANLHDHPMVYADREVGAELKGWIDEAAALGFVPEEQTLGKALSSRATDGIFDLHLFPVCASTQTVLTDGRALVEVACVTPRSRGRVDIVSRDPEAAPHIDHAYLTDPDDHDITVLRDGLVMAQDMLNHAALAPLLGQQVTDVSSDAAIRREVMHYYHPVGTCAMGTVCDNRGRVSGASNIVVADASLMPRIPRANTNIPAVVIGERMAGWLLG